MAELVPKLEGELCPVRTCSSKTYRNPPTGGTLKIGLWVIRSMIDIDAGKLSFRAVPPNFACRGLQCRRNIMGTNISKSVSLHLNMEVSRAVRHSHFAVCGKTDCGKKSRLD